MKWNMHTLMRDARWLALDVLALAACTAVFVALGAFVVSCARDKGLGDDRPEAYILVKPGAMVPLWDYQMLPMRDCAWCHRTVNLNRHHVVPQAANPALRDVRENLVVLCRDCHFVLGHRCDWKQYNPDVLYICTHFTNCVRSADTRYALTNGIDRLLQEVPAHVDVRTNVNIDAERILHATNDVPESMRPALERILESGN